jgi:hypothetical protein
MGEDMSLQNIDPRFVKWDSVNLRKFSTELQRMAGGVKKLPNANGTAGITGDAMAHSASLILPL